MYLSLVLTASRAPMRGSGRNRIASVRAAPGIVWKISSTSDAKVVAKLFSITNSRIFWSTSSSASNNSIKSMVLCMLRLLSKTSRAFALSTTA